MNSMESIEFAHDNGQSNGACVCLYVAFVTSNSLPYSCSKFHSKKQVRSFTRNISAQDSSTFKSLLGCSIGLFSPLIETFLRLFNDTHEKAPKYWNNHFARPFPTALPPTKHAQTKHIANMPLEPTSDLVSLIDRVRTTTCWWGSTRLTCKSLHVTR